MLVVNLALEFAIFVLLGIFIVRAKIVEKSFTVNLSRFVMNVALPCMIFNSIRSQTFAGDGQRLLLIMGLAVLVMAVLGVFIVVVYYFTGRNLFGRCMIFSTVFGNYTYVGMAAAESIYCEAGLFIYTIFTLPVRMIFYAAPSFLMRDSSVKAQTFKDKIKPFLSPPTVSVFVGLFFYFTGLQLPEFLSMAIKSVGSVASPLGMIICGMGLAGASITSLVKSKRIYLMVAMKNIVGALLVIGLLYILPIDLEIKKVAAIYGFVPVPSLITTFAIQMKCPDDVCEDCSSAVLLSTLLCILTLPLWVTVSNMIF